MVLWQLMHFWAHDLQLSFAQVHDLLESHLALVGFEHSVSWIAYDHLCIKK